MIIFVLELKIIFTYIHTHEFVLKFKQTKKDLKNLILIENIKSALSVKF